VDDVTHSTDLAHLHMINLQESRLTMIPADGLARTYPSILIDFGVGEISGLQFESSVWFARSLVGTSFIHFYTQTYTDSPRESNR